MKIRTGELSDAPILAEFDLRLADETEQLRLDPERVRNGVTALLKDPAKGLFFVAEIAGVVAGQLMITNEWSDWRNGNIWWIQSVYDVQDLARARADVCAVRLYVDAGNARAIRSYERLGMHRSHYEVFELDLDKAPG
jgi:hypothetical protein